MMHLHIRPLIQSDLKSVLQDQWNAPKCDVISWCELDAHATEACSTSCSKSAFAEFQLPFRPSLEQ